MPHDAKTIHKQLFWCTEHSRGMVTHMQMDAGSSLTNVDLALFSKQCTQRLQKFIYLYLATDCFMKISPQSSGQIQKN